MPVSLSLYLYRRYQREVARRFAKHNIVLSQKDIKRLIADTDTSRTLRILRSAVVDHVPVEGRPYYLRYPLESIFYHDGFKKAMIAEAMSPLAVRCDQQAYEDALTVLDELTDLQKSAPYVQVFAWHSLSEMIGSDPSLADDRKDKIIQAFGGRSGALVGALLVIEKLLEEGRRQHAFCIFNEGRKRVRYRVQKALLNAFMYYRKEFPDPREDPALEADIRHYLNRLDSRRYFTQEEIHEGLREIGLIPIHVKPELWANTPQKELAQRIEGICRAHIGAMGAFVRRW